MRIYAERHATDPEARRTSVRANIYFYRDFEKLTQFTPTGFFGCADLAQPSPLHLKNSYRGSAA
jgi:hypothetical protein